MTPHLHFSKCDLPPKISLSSCSSLDERRSVERTTHGEIWWRFPLIHVLMACVHIRKNAYCNNTQGVISCVVNPRKLHDITKHDHALCKSSLTHTLPFSPTNPEENILFWKISRTRDIFSCSRLYGFFTLKIFQVAQVFTDTILFTVDANEGQGKRQRETSWKFIVHKKLCKDMT